MPLESKKLLDQVRGIISMKPVCRRRCN